MTCYSVLFQFFRRCRAGDGPFREMVGAGVSVAIEEFADSQDICHAAQDRVAKLSIEAEHGDAIGGNGHSRLGHVTQILPPAKEKARLAIFSKSLHNICHDIFGQ